MRSLVEDLKTRRARAKLGGGGGAGRAPRDRTGVMRRLVAPAVAAMALLAGCGGGESTPKAAYEREFNAAREAFTARVQALDQPPNDAPADVRAVAGDEVAAEIARFVDGLEALEPPQEVARAHADLAAAFRESAALTALAADELRDGDEEGVRDIARKLSDRSAVDKRAEDAVQVFVENDYVLDLDFELGG
jgi:hypothetical protein